MPGEAKLTETSADQAQTVLVAGYFRLQPTDIEAGDIPATAEKDTAYLLHLKPGIPMPELPEGIRSWGKKRWKTRGVQVLIPSGYSMPDSITADDIDGVKKIDHSPIETESLRYGLEHHGGEAGTLAVMASDYELHPGLSNHLDALLPEEHREQMAAYGHLKLMMISEREVRSLGTNLIRAELETIGSHESTPGAPTTIESQRMFEKRGYVLGDRAEYGQTDATCGNGALVLCSPFLVYLNARHRDTSGFGVIQRPFVALTRARTKGDDPDAVVPSCAVLQLGVIALLTGLGYETIFEVTHTDEDGYIHNKVFEGNVLASYILNGPDGTPVIFTTNMTTLDSMFGGTVHSELNSARIRAGQPAKESLTPDELAASPLFAHFTEVLNGIKIQPVADGTVMRISFLDGGEQALACVVPAAPKIEAASKGVTDTPRDGGGHQATRKPSEIPGYRPATTRHTERR